jgi:hypothetical protein
MKSGLETSRSFYFTKSLTLKMESITCTVVIQFNCKDKKGTVYYLIENDARRPLWFTMVCDVKQWAYCVKPERQFMRLKIIPWA